LFCGEREQGARRGNKGKEGIFSLRGKKKGKKGGISRGERGRGEKVRVLEASIVQQRRIKQQHLMIMEKKGGNSGRSAKQFILAISKRELRFLI